MPPFFFLSYARLDGNEDGKYLDVFVRDLEVEIGLLTGESAAGLGFRDITQIVPGERWPDTVAEALRTSRVFLALYSPAYFKSKPCGQEWKAFQDRCRLHTPSKAGQALPLICPVLWVPVRLNDYPLPLDVCDIQYDHQEFGEKYRTDGLRNLIRLEPELYRTFVTRLARRLVEAVQRHSLPESPYRPDFVNLPSAFHSLPESVGTTPATAPAGAPETGPGHVQFLMLAARRSELTELRATLDSYGDHGRRWCPYRPTCEKPIGALVQSVAASADLTSDFLEPGPGLAAKLDEARRNKTILVVLVDPWSLLLPSYREHASDYDRRDFWNGTVLIPWNDQDAETQDRASELKDLIDGTFENKMNASKMARGRTWAYRGQVSSERQLAAELRRVLVQVRRVLIEQAENPRRAVGRRTVLLPQLAGPGGGES